MNNAQESAERRPRDYQRGYDEAKRGERFCPPDFRTDAAAAVAYSYGWDVAKREIAA